jgi:DNA-binding CsgD family transcriptional regulator/tetratricopeptide (TPR) repeat protein
MPTLRGLGFLGRAHERERFDAMLAQACDGHSAVLVVRGEAGIGKTALLRYAARQASGLRVAEIEGIEAEMELPFAGIDRLCAPMLEGLEVLAEPQQNALRVAFGLATGDRPDRFLVALAVLNLLSATAEQRPLLCLVDDAQWLDAVSLEALGFVARRLVAEPMAMIFSLREPATTRALDGLPQLSVEGLDESDARALLSRSVPGLLDDHVRDRIVVETRGNPLALVELSRRMSPSERAGGFAPPGARDLPSRLEERYLRRITGLPEATQRLMLLAAAEPLGDAALLWRAAERLFTDPSALIPARDAGLLEIDDRVRFHHPLVRSAVYRAASPDERRRVHDALADVSDDELAADRCAWHRALAAAEPDEVVAADLERSAGRAQGRGGLAAAAAFLERATALTPDPAVQTARALAAAEVSFEAGEFESTLRLLATAESGRIDGFQRARATLLRGHAALVSAYGSQASSLLFQAARELETFDVTLARRSYLTAWGAAVSANHLGGADVLAEICSAVLALPRLPPNPHPLDLLIEGFALLTTNGHAAATPVLQRAARSVVDLSVEDMLRWGWLSPGASSATWDLEGSLASNELKAEIVRQAGALGELPIHLQSLALDRTWSGYLAGAAVLVAESESVAAATATDPPPITLLMLRASQGRDNEATPLIERVVQQATEAGQGMAVMVGHWAASRLNNGLGRYEAAASAAREVIENAIDPWTPLGALPELVEAAIRLGETELACDAVDRLAATTQPAGTDFALGVEARSRALVSGGEAVEPLFHESIERLGRTPLRPELARARLVYGEWLRGEGRRSESREQLRIAEEMFTEMGMEAFADRTVAELIAAGAKPRTRRLEVCEELTPQEEQIARLARDGLTNAEIGGQLFLSPRTVEYHLHKVFGKLGIDARSGLDAALPG